MHSTTTRNEFLRLRVQGLSLACIGRRLGVSKPTLIAWNRQSHAEIDALAAEAQLRVKKEITDSSDQELAALTRRLTALKQELFSRAMRDIPSSCLETLAGELRQRIESIESAKTGPQSKIDPSAVELLTTAETQNSPVRRPVHQSASDDGGSAFDEGRKIPALLEPIRT